MKTFPNNCKPDRARSHPFRLLAFFAALAFFFSAVPAALAHQNPPGCTGSTLGINLFTDAPDVHVGDVLHYSITVFNGLPGTPRVGCDATAIQAFVVTPDGKTNFITLVRTTLLDKQSDYYTNAATYVVRAQDIRPDGTVRATANDTGVIHQNDVDSVGGGFQGVNTQVSQPCVLITAQCFGGVGENGAIRFSGFVTNCGNDLLVGVTLTNFVNNGSFTVLFGTNLAPGQIAPFSGSWIPANPCVPSTAVLVAQAVDQFTTFPRTVSSSAPITCSDVLTPGLLVTKTCPATAVSPGQLLAFSGTVTNTGNVTLKNIVVVNNQPVPNTTVFTLASLAPGATASFTGSYVAPAACSVADTLVATAATDCGVSVTNSASATCPITTTPKISVTAICPASPVLPGGLLTYSGTVRNTGDIALTNVVVVSDRPVANTTIFSGGTLAPGASATFTGSYTVPASGCAITATLAATGNNQCSGGTVTNIFLSTCNVTTAPAISVTLSCPATATVTGGLITYSGTVRNSGNVTLNNVSVVNNQPSANTVVLTVPSLAPGASASFTAPFTAPANACSVSSTVTASGNDNCTATPVSNSATATCTLVTTPGIIVTESCPVTPPTPGSPLTYTGTVRNSGNITLTNIVVLNNQSGASPVFTAPSLAPGATASFSGSYVAPTNCSSPSISTATGRSICGVAVTNTASANCPVATAAQLSVTTVCPSTPVLAGGVLTYTGTVRNTGNVPLTNVVVISDRPAANTVVFTASTLAAGASTTFTGSYAVPADVCSVTANLKITGKEPCAGATVANTFVATCTVSTAPAIAVTLACPSTAVITGGSITYTGTVRNTGNVTLNNVSVVDNQPSANTTVLTIPSLAPGVSASFTAAFTAPANACSVSSTVTATGMNNCTGAPVTNSASATCTLVTTPGIIVTENCPVNAPAPGSPLTYTGTVRNSGNITLTNIVVLNNQSGGAPVFTAPSLAPGATASFSGSYAAPTNCSSTSISTATGQSICGVSVTNTASATCTVLTSPEIEVTMTCAPSPVLPGGLLTYSGTVRNTGDSTLINIIVLNNRTGTNAVFTLPTLAPGASANFSGSYVTATNCCTDTSTVTASGQGCSGLTVTDTATRTCTMLTIPGIVVTKVCPVGPLKVGDLLAFSGTVSNSGNITLINVTVADSQSTNNSPVLGPIDLAPGETVAYTGSYVVPPDFCGADTVTATGFDLCLNAPVSNKVTTTCPIVTAPGISVLKNCAPVPTARGALYTFTGSVTNTGNVTLINVMVVNDQPTNNTPVFGPVTLAPGASATFSGSYIAPLCCCELVDTLTASGNDRCASTLVKATSTQVCPLLTTPGITITEVCPATTVPIGGLLVFTGSVSNSGDITLTNVLVFSPQSGSSPVLGPMELAPGESEEFSGSYTVTSVANVLTVAGTDICQARTVTGKTSCPGALQIVPPVISVSQGNGTVNLSFSSQSGPSYTVQYKNFWSDPSWKSLPNMPVTGTGGLLIVPDATAGQPSRFYRVLVIP